MHYCCDRPECCYSRNVEDFRLWITKAVEYCFVFVGWGLMSSPPSRSLEDSGTEITVNYGGPAQEVL